MKVLKLLTSVVLIVFVLNGCISPKWRAGHPSQHPGSTYVSEDGSMTIIIEEDTDTHKGYFEYNGECIDVVYTGIKITSNMITMKSIEQYESNSEEDIVRFRYVTVYKNRFIVEVVDDFEYFEEGERITFIRYEGDGGTVS